MQHQLGYGLGLHAVVNAAVVVNHVVPIVMRAVEPCLKFEQCAVVGCEVVKFHSFPSVRPLVEIHDLRHGCSHAARNIVLSRRAANARYAVCGCHVIIWSILPPAACQKFVDTCRIVAAFKCLDISLHLSCCELGLQ